MTERKQTVYSLNPTHVVAHRGEGGARIENGDRDSTDALDELTAYVHRTGKVVVVLVSVLCALALTALAVGLVAFATASQQKTGGGSGAYGGAQYVSANGIYVNASSCMTDAQLQTVGYFVVNVKATHGAVYSLRPASTVRIPVTTTSCGTALLVRSLDPTYDVMLVETNAALITKAQTVQMVTLLMTETPL
jgi:hypothetical protein